MKSLDKTEQVPSPQAGVRPMTSEEFENNVLPFVDEGSNFHLVSRRIALALREREQLREHLTNIFPILEEDIIGDVDGMRRLLKSE